MWGKGRKWVAARGNREQMRDQRLVGHVQAGCVRDRVREIDMRSYFHAIDPDPTPRGRSQTFRPITQVAIPKTSDVHPLEVSTKAATVHPSAVSTEATNEHRTVTTAPNNNDHRTTTTTPNNHDHRTTTTNFDECVRIARTGGEVLEEPTGRSPPLQSGKTSSAPGHKMAGGGHTRRIFPSNPPRRCAVALRERPGWGTLRGHVRLRPVPT